MKIYVSIIRKDFKEVVGSNNEKRLLWSYPADRYTVLTAIEDALGDFKECFSGEVVEVRATFESY